MKISVITICYNEKDVEKTCKSILGQTFQDFEWIVIDGGSNREILDVLNKYKDRMNIFISEEDTGIYNAMNKGIKIAKGEYLQFLNAGDFYYNNKALSDVELTGEDIIYGNLEILTNSGSWIKTYSDKLEYGYFAYESLPHPSSFIKRELFEKYGSYNEYNKIVSDWEKWIEFIDIHKCSYKRINTTVASFNLNGASATEASLEERAKIVEKYYPGYVWPQQKKYIKFLKIPLLKIVKQGYNKDYYLFGFLKICRIKRKVRTF